MSSNFNKVKQYLLDLDYDIVFEDKKEEVLVIKNESAGIVNMVLGCADPILIMEQYLVHLKQPTDVIYADLLQKNREIIHGAFVLDDTGTKVIFRDTLQLENLDANELAGSLNSLSVLLSEYSHKLIQFSKN
ncbi:MAG TPA: molecular chaperone Tir [Bacteroidales bacterium]|nr:molecular chaperone Tir [Bacteroidales bacterium]